MKKSIVFSLLLLLIGFTTSCDKETVLSADKIPNEITQFVENHFSNETILQVVKDMDGVQTTYDVVLSNNFQLEFNRKKEVIEIKGVQALPSSVIPAPIEEYVHLNYANNSILSWENEKEYQEVKLDNELELQFSLEGEFLRIDD